MSPGADEVMLIPVDTDAAVVEPFVTSVECDVLADTVLVLGYEVFYPAERCFFFNSENKDQISFCFDSGLIKRAHRGEHRFDITGVIADSRREYFTVSDLGL